jgi:site-specific DNA recombinase
MIGVLKDLNMQAIAIDRPINFEVPESIVMLAVYLSIPETKNSRRGKNTSDGLRRAKKLGRWPGKAPIGYANISTPDDKSLLRPSSMRQTILNGYFSSLRKASAIALYNCSPFVLLIWRLSD